MIKKIFRLIGLLALVLVAVLLLNTLVFTSRQPQVTAAPPMTPPDKAVVHLQQAIRFRTISLSETAPLDTASFRQFHDFLERSYPLVFSRLELQRVNDLSLWFTWKGKDTLLAPAVIMAH